MPNLDYSRKYDLEELYVEWKKEPQKRFRDELEKIMSDIIHQSGASREFRDKLIQTIRSGDHRARKYYENKLLLIKQEKENGKQF